MLPLSMSNEAFSLPSWTILPGRVNLYGQKEISELRGEREVKMER